ncbi:GLPGLI family protein [Mucilaginibacter antarcticus]|uniref:GLPGLI family protein n=1 Tax=Mucilaginibacter antarcticus TaxID=1855725 RepID=A0ABW5XM64_9SPHI
MKKIIYIAFTLMLFTDTSMAQTRFVKSGTIEYDKNINMYALLQREVKANDENSWAKAALESYKKTHGQIKVVKSTLKFSDNKTLFTPIEEEERRDYYFDTPMADQLNTTYTDIATSTRLSQKKVFEEQFLVSDSTAKIKWKVTGETREILGYTCRRANGLILDSIYVVAFYTDQIPVSGGPESFSGLPGMILQVALPHENVSWLATKVTDTALPANAIAAPKKGKPLTKKQFQDKLKSAMKNWGEYANSYLKSLQL